MREPSTSTPTPVISPSPLTSASSLESTGFLSAAIMPSETPSDIQASDAANIARESAGNKPSNELILISI